MVNICSVNVGISRVKPLPFSNNATNVTGSAHLQIKYVLNAITLCLNGKLLNSEWKRK